MTETMLYVQGKKVGTTNVSVFDAQKRLVAVIDLEVTPDVATLHSKIAASTGGKSIGVSSVNGQVVLSGEAGDSVAAARAVEVAKGLSPSAPVIDAMRVTPSQQVMLKVRMLEVDRNAGRDLGVNWFGGNKNGLGVSGLGALPSSVTAVRSTVTGETLSASSSGTANGISTTSNISGTGIGFSNNGTGSTYRRDYRRSNSELGIPRGRVGGRAIRGAVGASHQHSRTPDRYVGYGSGGQRPGEEPRGA